MIGLIISYLFFGVATETRIGLDPLDKRMMKG